VIPPFDPTRAHGQVFGMEPACWQQYGHYYMRDGTPLPEEAPPAPFVARPPLVAEKAEAAPKAQPEANKAEPPMLREFVPREVGPDDMRRKSNQLLKAQLEVYGETFTTAAAARQFLGGKV